MASAADYGNLWWCEHIAVSAASADRSSFSACCRAHSSSGTNRGFSMM